MGFTWGIIEANESVAQAAIRETREETGLEVELTHLVGIYSRPNWPIGDGSGNHTILFAAEVVGGSLSPQTEEVLELGFFELDQLPAPMFWWQHQPIKDVMLRKGGGVVWSQNIEMPFLQDVTSLTRQELYESRDRGELSLDQIHSQLCGLPQPKDEVLEVKG